MLGETLIRNGLLPREQLERLLAIGRNTRTRLGDILVGEGMISFPDLYQQLAQAHGLPFINLLKTPIDTALLDAVMAEDYVRMRTMPCRMENGRLLLATAEYCDTTLAWARMHYGENIAFAITSPVDIHRIVQKIFATTLSHKSVMGLYESNPDASARRRHTWLWKMLLPLLVLAIAGAIHQEAWPQVIVLFAACHILYAITMLFKCLIYGAGLKPAHAAYDSVIPDNELPVYTVLIPMYKEIESLPGMLEAMRAIDYPASKLDIKLVFEADDHDTWLAAQALKPRYHFEIIRVPESQPRTKPKACNYALHFARGDYVTVYDADDRPDPKQLKKAASAFRRLPPDVVCLQARLNYYNTNDNWLTRLFSLEYAMLFHVLLHGMSRLGMPVMLGGTSNHIALARLRLLGEWDPFNVTEDADLGTRLAAQGLRTMMLDSDTMEEAPNSILAWLKQRTRWIKGYMQTWLVHMRHPIRLGRGLRPVGFVGFQCFVALSSFSYLTAPFSWAVAAFWLVDSSPIFPLWLYTLSLVNLVANLVIHIATAGHISGLYRKHHGIMALTAMFYPFYLIFHSVASYIALWQLITKPYAWNKTSHGKAKTFAEFQLTNTRTTR